MNNDEIKTPSRYELWTVPTSLSRASRSPNWHMSDSIQEIVSLIMNSPNTEMVLFTDYREDLYNGGNSIIEYLTDNNHITEEERMMLLL